MPRQNAPATAPPEGGLNAIPLRFVLSGIVLVSALPLFYLAVTQRIEFDGYWNAFISIQDRWQNLIAQYEANPHPPLYYLFLRAGLWFGRSHLAYRAVSVLAGLGTVYLVGAAASRLTRSALAAALAALAALAYGLATPTMAVSLEVRGYMLCTFFLLLSYCWFLDVLTSQEPAGTLRLRIAFAATAALACLADYYSFFYVAAVLFLGAVFAVVRNPGSRVKALAREAATSTPVLAVMAFLYFTHTEAKAGIWGHLRSYYYDETGTESIGEFLLRNLQNDFNLLSPWKVKSQPVFLAILASLLLAAGATLWLVRRMREPKNLTAAATVLATILMTLQLMLVGVLDKYPFGGELRHQFLLFPFLILCACVLLDRLAAAIPQRAAWALAGILGVAIVVVGYRGFEAYPRASEALMSGEMQRFDRLFPAPAAVYVDRFNLYAFFIHHDDWTWEFQGRARSAPRVDVYRLSRAGRRVFVLADNSRWVLEYDDATLYDDLAACMRAEGLRAIDVFRVGQVKGPPRQAAEILEYSKLAAAMAARHGVCLQQLAVQDWDAYAEVRAGRCEATDGGQ